MTSVSMWFKKMCAAFVQTKTIEVKMTREDKNERMSNKNRKCSLTSMTSVSMWFKKLCAAFVQTKTIEVKMTREDKNERMSNKTCYLRMGVGNNCFTLMHDGQI